MIMANINNSTSIIRAMVIGILPHSRLDRQLSFVTMDSDSCFSSTTSSEEVSREADSDVVGGRGCATLPVCVSGRCCGRRAGAIKVRGGDAKGETGDLGDGGAVSVNSASLELAIGLGTGSIGVALASAAKEALVGPSSGCLEYGGSCSMCPNGPMISCSSPSGPICL